MSTDPFCRDLPFDRRTLLVGAAAALVSGCMSPGMVASGRSVAPASYAPPPPPRNAAFASSYAAIYTEPFPIPAVDVSNVESRFLRQEVPYDGGEAPGTIIVDPNERHLYHVMDGNRAMRYGVGVGREGFGWSGRATVQRKAAWPTWTPPASMIDRQPELAEFAGGMEPGLMNPLGARALYLFENGRDTLYRIHGTNEPWSIGQAMSSGCIRLFNQDIIHLHNRTEIGTPVVVREPRGQFGI
jgi:lipoprotein-anchoring transpeptidase ErfK/SrfK